MASPPSSTNLRLLKDFFLTQPLYPTQKSPNLTLTTILSPHTTNTDLERSHTYIQLLFPLPERSPIHPSAPLIDLPVYTAFRTTPALRAALLLGWTRMLSFYGLTYNPTSPSLQKVSFAETWDERKMNWLPGRYGGFNHNHLRITRILRSLRVLGCEEEAGEMWEGLKRVNGREGGRVPGRSFEFWRRAAERDIWVAPDEEEGSGVGGWLWKAVKAEEEGKNDVVGKGEDVWEGFE